MQRSQITNVWYGALAEHLLDVTKALELMTDAERQRRFVDKHRDEISAGYYRAGAGGVRVNLQCAEVYLTTKQGGTRMLMPVPTFIADNDDFKRVFGRSSKYVVEVAHTTKVQELELTHEGVVEIAQALKEVGKRKICVITGASSGLGLHAVTALTSSYEGYYVIAAVRDTAKMDEAAAEMGIDAKDYKAVKLECASLASVRDFSKELKRLLRGRETWRARSASRSAIPRTF